MGLLPLVWTFRPAVVVISWEVRVGPDQRSDFSRALSLTTSATPSTFSLAVSRVCFTDRAILRDTLLLTLAKTQDEKKALGDCFDLFFDQAVPHSPPDEGKADEADQP